MLANTPAWLSAAVPIWLVAKEAPMARPSPALPPTPAAAATAATVALTVAANSLFTSSEATRKVAAATLDSTRVPISLVAWAPAPAKAMPALPAKDADTLAATDVALMEPLAWASTKVLVALTVVKGASMLASTWLATWLRASATPMVSVNPMEPVKAAATAADPTSVRSVA